MKKFTISLLSLPCFAASLILISSLNTRAITSEKKVSSDRKSRSAAALMKGFQEIRTPENFYTLTKSGKSTILKFYAQWCPPCKEMAPIFESAAQIYSEKINFAAIDVDTPGLEGLVEKFIKKGIPTVVFLDENGNTKKIHAGGYDKDEFDRVIKQFIGKQ